jgi:hypothetical protein
LLFTSFGLPEWQIMSPTDPSEVRASLAKFSVFVDENSQSMDESKRYRLGEFLAYEDAVARCREIIDEFLAVSHRPGMNAEELFQSFTAFGEAPFISPDIGKEPFSALKYARARCAAICR